MARTKGREGAPRRRPARTEASERRVRQQAGREELRPLTEHWRHGKPRRAVQRQRVPCRQGPVRIHLSGVSGEARRGRSSLHMRPISSCRRRKIRPRRLRRRGQHRQHTRCAMRDVNACGARAGAGMADGALNMSHRGLINMRAAHNCSSRVVMPVQLFVLAAVLWHVECAGVTVLYTAGAAGREQGAYARLATAAQQAPRPALLLDAGGFFGAPQLITHLLIIMRQCLSVHAGTDAFFAARNGSDLADLMNQVCPAVACCHVSHITCAGRVQCCGAGSARALLWRAVPPRMDATRRLPRHLHQRPLRQPEARCSKISNDDLTLFLQRLGRAGVLADACWGCECGGACRRVAHAVPDIRCARSFNNIILNH